MQTHSGLFHKLHLFCFGFFLFLHIIFYCWNFSVFWSLITVTELLHLNNSSHSICVYFWQVDEIFFMHGILVLAFDIEVWWDLGRVSVLNVQRQGMETLMVVRIWKYASREIHAVLSIYCAYISMIAWDMLNNKKVNPDWKLCTYSEEVTKIWINQMSVVHIVVPCLGKNNAMVTSLLFQFSQLLACWLFGRWKYISAVYLTGVWAAQGVFYPVNDLLMLTLEWKILCYSKMSNV